MRSTEPPSNNDRLIQRYLDFLRLERRYSEHSVLAVRRDLSFIEGSLATVSVGALKTILVKRHAGGSAPSSLARMASSWRGFFGFLLDAGQIEVNPALGLKTPKLPRALPKAVGVDQLAALLQGPLPEQYRLAQAHVLIELLYCTGLRISEALSLSNAVLANSTELRVQGKGNKTRIVPVINALRERFAEFSDLRTKHLTQLCNPPASALFVSAKGLPLSARQAQKDVSEFSKLRGLDQHLHPHMLRHSFGSHMLQSTQNLRAVQELLGHASIASTQVYTALDFDHLSGVYDKAFPRAK
ncbi:MAG: tyrosine recombinase XerC [Gammaproteobacteria bacterium]|uniref:tyrosine recombinase XerC n=1 Tax=Limnobacter sp. TaxID=2003368 RepID=UPI001DE6684C|nr:tyrosine recombinase XerC [Limnobacter sp.]MBU0784059.1 tyrosine recombinase XerC [Gammaproteobacteria bacterium]MBU0848955.1 tyrosine recombinase XerC [Gammaproteobacteria bacterium]MBU1268233.1 tyrosine recombinase XerC [Gammaproteobacteria bacterium]MBU1527790.1 tyrosine recombinase XerC [Gammaproteobacteria bacterium]MBU1778832.1 tyrosine recombinase XerC [Gammaproteobacteria bacterium]